MNFTPQRSCPACRSVPARKKYKLKDCLFHTAEGEFQYLECQNCRTLYLDPLPTESQVAAFYPKEYWWHAESSHRMQHLEQSYRNWIIRDHLRFLPAIRRIQREKPPELLDIGCGSGAFLWAARKRGYSVTGMDFSPRAVENLVRQGIPCRQATTEEFDFGNTRFDVISLFHVLEHLRNPGQALRSVLRLAHSNTVFLLQVPLLDSLQSRFFGSRWYGLDPPRHLTQFTAQGLAALLENVGLAIEKKWYFSLRDNAPAMVSSQFPFLDPMARRGRNAGRIHKERPAFGMVMHFAYFFLVLTCTPLAILEAAMKKGGTVVLKARIRHPSERPDGI